MQNQDGSGFSALLDSLKGSLERRRELQGATQSTRESAQGIGRFEDQVEVCAEHGPWKRYALNDRGILGARPMCPGCSKQAGIKQSSVYDSIPPRFADASFETYETPSIQQAAVLDLMADYARDFATRRPASGVILWGDGGTGKSHLAVSLVRHVVTQGCSVYYTTAWALLDRIHRSKMFNAERDEITLIDRLSVVDLLVIEDIGKSATTEREAAQFFALLDARWSACKPTVVTTNEPPEVLRSLVTPAGYERLAEGARVIHLDWVSRRRAVHAPEPLEKPLRATEPPGMAAWRSL